MPLRSSRYTCEFCQHWQQTGETVLVAADDETDFLTGIRMVPSADKWGICKRYPPRQESFVTGSANFPATQSFNWCGEFKEDDAR